MTDGLGVQTVSPGQDDSRSEGDVVTFGALIFPSCSFCPYMIFEVGKSYLK